MKAEELRTKTIDELNQQLKDLLEEQFKLRMQHGSGQLVNTSGLRRVRKDIARVKTTLGQASKATEVKGETA